MGSYFLGIDASTQSMSGLVIDLEKRRVFAEASVPFDDALPHYGTENGVLPSEEEGVAHSPPEMWVGTC